MDTDQNSLSAERGAYISIIAYIFLASLKLTVGYFGHSKGLWADGLNNATDIVASVAVLIGLKISKIPPDKNHAYGHLRAETIASLIAAFIMITVGIDVITGAIEDFFTEDTQSPSILTAITALFSAAFMYGIYRYNVALSRKINSASIYAVAQDNRSDALVSVGALVGILGTYIGIAWLDGVAAIVVGIIICKTAVEIFLDASHSLTDGFDEELLQKIGVTISKTEGVKDMSAIKARMHGNEILVEATIHVNPLLTVIESHEITVQVEQNLLSEHNVKYAIIHIEPYTTSQQ
ncbi:cation diffusion facilitator family transporter [Peribacillus asahii]|uniref:Transporter n=1 Tax=Peribacillus asahii TaxID=228899 RepID=A0A3Q9RKT9_9BACI|nr:cation diffusion facilitator family transporter [Peribacillus asahii]AZV41515.1 transporter [Peribacillus asahii]USK85908.1 cation diffusion facilitator family transporter [Peribacillus asahii]